MQLYIVYSHPSSESFSREILRSFTRGLEEAGHTYEVFDLFAAGFQSDLDATEYVREVGGVPAAPLPSEVEEEHRKIALADALVFVYHHLLERLPSKALVICSAGHTE